MALEVLHLGSGYRASSLSGEPWRADFRLQTLQKEKKALQSPRVCASSRTFTHEKESPELGLNRISKGRTVQWYPGHIAKAERALKEHLLLVDVVIEVRDARIPWSTGHPELDSWIAGKGKKKILVLNREDMVSTSDKNSWSSYYTSKGSSVVFMNGQLGKGTMKLAREACTVAAEINSKRKLKGLLPRSVRAAVVGYPNVGKSSIINRLVKRRVCDAAQRPGVTRQLRWSTILDGLDLLDSPGILPMKLEDQAAALKLAICNDIGEESYESSAAAAVLLDLIKTSSSTGNRVLSSRYKFDAAQHSSEMFMYELAHKLFRGNMEQAATRILNDYRKGKFGWFALESPPQ